MGLLDTVINDVVGGNTGGNAPSSPIGSVLSELLQGGGGGPAGGSGGGLGALLSQFEGAGLGHLTQSWMGNGQNQPVSPQQLQSVLGEDRVQGLAQRAGMQPQDLLTQLSQHLPNVISRSTPTGQLPNEGSVSV